MDIRRPGLTRPELLVIFGMVFLLVGFAIPAVGKARAVSDRDACKNNLKQLGQAALKYADMHNGQLPGAGGGGRQGGGSFILRVLPYTDYSKVSEALAKSDKPWYDPENAEIVAKHLPIAQCPATPKPDRLIEGSIAGNDFKAAPTDYTAAPQITVAIRDIFPPDYDLTTPLSGSLNEITDGVSTTFLGLLEIADKPNRWQAGKLAEREAGKGGGGNGTWVANGINAPRGYTKDGKSFPGPGAMNCNSFAAVYSFHPDGCNFVFADGSVRFLKKDIDVWVFYAGLTRRGGELLTSRDFE